MNPQEANIPYLAWSGENVKLARSFDWGFFPGIAEQSVTGMHDAGYDVELAVMNWTGDPFYKPTVINGTLDSSGYYHGPFLLARTTGLYVSGVVVDDHPGIAKIKMFVTRNGDLVKEQVFEVAWMTLVKPTLHEMSNDDLAALSNDQPSLGDPKGDGKFVPLPAGHDELLLGHHPQGDLDLGLGYLDVFVKGTFPFPNAAGFLTMPDDWAALASDPVYGAVTKDGPDPMAWDIHGHHAMKVWDDTDMTPLWMGGPKIGPFDPLIDWWQSTNMPDGLLDTYDAPMPADRIDFSIAAGGVGTFKSVEKEDVYVQTGTHHWSGDDFVATWRDDWRYLYAPFYKAYIPASARDNGSGIYAADYAGDFPPFLNHHNPYEYWQLLNKRVLNADRADNPNTCRDELGSLTKDGKPGVRPSPAGVPDTVSVYTDEHGEAIVGYEPYAGFYFNSDTNDRCDLGDGSTPFLLGQSVITATAIYPYEQAAGGSVASDPVTKLVYGDPMKALSFTAKSHNEAVVTETIHDILGNPVEGAEVLFSTDPAGPRLVAEIGKVVDNGEPGLTLLTDENGQAAVDVIASQGVVNLMAENLGTRVGGAGVLRDMRIDFTGAMPKVVSGGGSGQEPVITTTTVVNNNTTTTVNNVAGGGGTVTTTTPGTTVTTTTATTTTDQVVTTIGKEKVVASKVASVKLVVSKVGRYVTVKVTGSAAKATVKIKVLGKGHKVIKTVTKSVPTNKVVRVSGLVVPKLARSVTAGIVR